MNNTIQKFYTAFSEKDWQTMQACYHHEVTFEDPAFGKLHGDEAKKMWRMLCEQGKDLKIEFSEIVLDENVGSAHWEAWYTFSKTKKKVHKPSATILSLTLTLSFRKDLLSCSMAIFRRIPFKKGIESRKSLNS